MEFRDLSLKDFNQYRDTALTECMGFEEIAQHLEDRGESFFYISLAQDDVTDAIKEEQEIADQFDLDLIYILPQGVAVALQI